MKSGIFFIALIIFGMNLHANDCTEKKDTKKGGQTTSSVESLLSDSNQRPRDYKSRALAN